MRKTGWAGLVLWIAGAALLGAGPKGSAQGSGPTYQFNLRAMGVGGALRLFGEVTHQQIIFSEATVKGRQSHAVVGSFTAAHALELLLTGTGLKITRTEAGVFYIENSAADAQ